MSSNPQPSGENKATTRNGEAYNRLRRPDDFLTSLEAPAPPTLPAASKPAASKRKLDGADESGREGKKSRHEKGTVVKLKERKKNESGMCFAFDTDDEDSDAEPTVDAKAYLRGVWSESRGLPPLHRHEAKDEEQESGSEHTKGKQAPEEYPAFCRDGTWIALDRNAPKPRSSDPRPRTIGDLSPQEVWARRILRQYKDQRQKFANIDRKALAADVKANPEKYRNPKPPRNKKEWMHALYERYPTPATVMQLNEEQVFEGIGYAAKIICLHNTISKYFGCWIWALLALATERGTLSHLREGQIRDLGHKAGQLAIRLRNKRVRAQKVGASKQKADGVTENTENMDDGGFDDNSGEDGDQVTMIVPKGVHLEEAEEKLEASEQHNDEPKEANDVGLVASEDEGEIRSEEEMEGSTSKHGSKEQGGKEGSTEDAVETMETARARLLAQLGENLVDTKVPGPNGSRKQTEKQHPNSGKTKISAPNGTKAAKNGQKDQQVSSRVATGSLQARLAAARASRTDGQEGRVLEGDELARHTRMALDTILTVVAEFYGQKDLLQYREVW